MNYTNAYNHLHNIYDTMGVEFIRTEFQYLNHHFYLYYLNPDVGTDLIHLEIQGGLTPNAYSVFGTFPFIHTSKGVLLNPFFPNKEYRTLKKNLFCHTDYSPTPVFTYIHDHLLTLTPRDFVNCQYGHISRSRARATVRTTNGTIAKSYFMTTRTSNISQEMKNRISAEYPNSLKIINFLENKGFTLVFTDDYDRRRDFFAFMEGKHDFTL